MKVYHGSKNIIAKPEPHGSYSYNDYGPSFYMTLDLEVAKSWAYKNDIPGIVNVYNVDESKFKSLRVLDLTNKDKYSVLNWVAILMHFRLLDPSFIRNNRIALDWLEKYYIDVDEYDIVIGFRADDAYFRFPTRFISNDLAIEDLEYIFKLGNLGVQYAFMSNKAIKLLKFKEAIECENEYAGYYFSIVNKAREEFNALINQPRDPKKTYILDLIRKDYE